MKEPRRSYAKKHITTIAPTEKEGRNANNKPGSIFWIYVWSRILDIKKNIQIKWVSGNKICIDLLKSENFNETNKLHELLWWMHKLDDRHPL